MAWPDRLFIFCGDALSCQHYSHLHLVLGPLKVGLKSGYWVLPFPGLMKIFLELLGTGPVMALLNAWTTTWKLPVITTHPSRVTFLCCVLGLLIQWTFTTHLHKYPAELLYLWVQIRAVSGGLLLGLCVWHQYREESQETFLKGDRMWGFCLCCSKVIVTSVLFFSLGYTLVHVWLWIFHRAETINAAKGRKQVVVFGWLSAAWNGFLLYIPVLTDISANTRLVLLYFPCTSSLITHPSSSDL